MPTPSKPIVPPRLAAAAITALGTPQDGWVIWNTDTDQLEVANGGAWGPVDAVGGGGGAPTTADYLVGTTNGGLSAEIVVGTTPGGELGGTWASPTVDATHSGSTHAAVQAAAEATAAGALSTHEADTTSIHGITNTANLVLTSDTRLSDDRTTPGSAITASVAVAATETVLCSYVCAANELTAGTAFDFAAWFDQAGTNAAVPNVRIRIGTTTLTGTVIASVSGTVGGSGTSGWIRGMVTIRTAGAGGTAAGNLTWLKGGQAVIMSGIGTGAVNTTSANQRVELTFASGNAANTYTFGQARIMKSV